MLNTMYNFMCLMNSDHHDTKVRVNGVIFGSIFADAEFLRTFKHSTCKFVSNIETRR